MANGKIVISPEVFKQRMEVINENFDIEEAHGDADKLMCDLLDSLGYDGGVEIFRRMEKWYA